MGWDCHIQGMVPAPPLTMDEPARRKPLPWQVDCHIRRMVPAPPVMMQLGEESSFLEVDCRTRGRCLATLSMM